MPGFCPQRVVVFQSVAELVCASQGSSSGGGGGGVGEMEKWCLFAALDIIGSSGFDYEFRALESASISDNINSQEKPGPKLVDTI